MRERGESAEIWTISHEVLEITYKLKREWYTNLMPVAVCLTQITPRWLLNMAIQSYWTASKAKGSPGALVLNQIPNQIQYLLS